jgi:DNA-directed RNA polymerase subunit RPC12/RpoP
LFQELKRTESENMTKISPENTNVDEIMCNHPVPIAGESFKEIKRKYRCSKCRITYEVFTTKKEYTCTYCGLKCVFIEDVDTLACHKKIKPRIKNNISELRCKRAHYNPYKGIMEMFDDKKDRNK